MLPPVRVVLLVLALFGPHVGEAQETRVRRSASITVDANSGREHAHAPILAAAQAGGHVYFRAQHDDLLVTEGTPESTRFIQSFEHLGSPLVEKGLTVGETLWLPVSSWGLGPTTIWRTDGTQEGTYLLSAFSDTYESPQRLRAAAQVTEDHVFTLFYHAQRDWRLTQLSHDGLETHILAEGLGYPVSGLVPSSDGYWFVIRKPLALTHSLYHWSRSSSSLALLGDLPGTLSYQGTAHTNGDTLWFIADRITQGMAGTGVLLQTLWAYRGTQAGKAFEEIASLPNSAEAFHPWGIVACAGEEFLITNFLDLWRSDGTIVGTTPIAGNPPISDQTRFVEDGKHVRWVSPSQDAIWRYEAGLATSLTTGDEITAHTTFQDDLYVIDQSGSRLRRVDVGIDQSITLYETERFVPPTLALTGQSNGFFLASPTSPLLKLGGKLLLIENCPSPRSSVLRSVTETMTEELALLNPTRPIGSSSSNPSPTAISKHQFYWTNEIEPGLVEMWCDDSLAGTTLRLAEFQLAPGSPPGVDVVAHNDTTLYFSLTGADRKRSLWQTSGTSESTEKLGDMIASAGGLLRHGNLYYRGRYRTLTRLNLETKQVTEFPGFDAAWADLIPVGNKVFIEAKTASDWQHAWWVLDENEGISRIAELNDGFNFEYEATPLGNRLLYFSRKQGVKHLWSSDGTREGTKPIVPANAALTKVIGDEMWYVSYRSGNSVALWKTDGTPAGTQETHKFHDTTVVDILPLDDDWIGIFLRRYSEGVNHHDFWRVHRKTSVAEFVAPVGQGIPVIFEHAFWWQMWDSGDAKLWRSDGTAQGTGMVSIEGPEANPPTSVVQGPGFESSWITATEDRLYLPLYQAQAGVEVWTIQASQYDQRSTARLHLSIKADRLDSDRDGTHDLLEFVFGTDPHQVTAPPVVEVATGGLANTAIIRIPSSITASGTDLSIERSVDLINWTEIVRLSETNKIYPNKQPLADHINANGIREITIQSDTPNKAYLRLRYTMK